jgi:hypothetical protein
LHSRAKLYRIRNRDGKKRLARSCSGHGGAERRNSPCTPLQQERFHHHSTSKNQNFCSSTKDIIRERERERERSFQFLHTSKSSPKKTENLKKRKMSKSKHP